MYVGNYMDMYLLISDLYLISIILYIRPHLQIGCAMGKPWVSQPVPISVSVEICTCNHGYGYRFGRNLWIPRQKDMKHSFNVARRGCPLIVISKQVFDTARRGGFLSH